MISLPSMSREALSRMLADCPDHYVPIIEAVRDHRCGFGQIMQDAGPFTLPLSRNKPSIVVIGDDLPGGTAKGPDAFHEHSLYGLVERCGAAFIISSAAEVATYRMATQWPIKKRRHVILIETLPPFEDAWADLVEAAKPTIHILMSKVDPLARPEPQTWGRA